MGKSMVWMTLGVLLVALAGCSGRQLVVNSSGAVQRAQSYQKLSPALDHLDQMGQRAVESFTDSLYYDQVNRTLSFSVPDELPEGYSFYLNAQGELVESSRGEVLTEQAFAEQSSQMEWEPGLRYTHTFSKGTPQQCLVEMGLVREGSDMILYNTLIRIDQEGNCTISYAENFG